MTRPPPLPPERGDTVGVREGDGSIRSCPQVLAAKLGQEGGKFGAALKESSDDFAAERVFSPRPTGAASQHHLAPTADGILILI